MPHYRIGNQRYQPDRTIYARNAQAAANKVARFESTAKDKHTASMTIPGVFRITNSAGETYETITVEEITDYSPPSWISK